MAARWRLWTVAIISVFTVRARLHAYNTVNHDAPSHAANMPTMENNEAHTHSRQD